MNRARWLSWAAAGLLALMALSVVASIVLSRLQVEHSQAQWCDTLRLLTARPVPRPADPAREPTRYENYIFYSDLVHLRHRFGC